MAMSMAMGLAFVALVPHVCDFPCSVGNKYIKVLLADLPAATVTLTVTGVATAGPAGAPFIRNFAVHSGCNALGAQQDQEWAAAGW
jgi:hypothetical protein